MYGGGLVAKSCLPLMTPWTKACQAPLSMGFPRQEYWSGLPFPPPGDLPNWPRDQTHISCTVDRLFTTEPPGKPQICISSISPMQRTKGPIRGFQFHSIYEFANRWVTGTDTIWQITKINMLGNKDKWITISETQATTYGSHLQVINQNSTKKKKIPTSSAEKNIDLFLKMSFICVVYNCIFWCPCSWWPIP